MTAIPHAIGRVATSIALFIGWAAKGPDDKAVGIASFADYERTFGGLDAATLLGHCVKHFFDNGGTDAYVVRLTARSGTNGLVLTPGSPGFHAALLSDRVFAAGGIIDAIDLFNLVCIPGESHASTLAIVQTHCARRRAFLLIDADATATVASLKAGLQAGVPAALISKDAANAAMFFPWLRAPDPVHVDALADVPPCGFVAGAFARNDRLHGVWKTAAGLDAALIGAAAPSIALSDLDQEMLNSLAVNCIRKFPGAGNVVWGARTLLGQDASPSEWKYIPVRRPALFLEESIARGVGWAAFEPNAEALWAELRTSVTAFMLGLFRDRAFQGATPAEAFFVRCDATTTTQADIDNGIVNIIVGFAPLKPAEFVIISIRQLAGGAKS
jgi:uncharacterized protein